jgi:hypothetical protein
MSIFVGGYASLSQHELLVEMFERTTSTMSLSTSAQAGVGGHKQHGHEYTHSPSTPQQHRHPAITHNPLVRQCGVVAILLPCTCGWGLAAYEFWQHFKQVQ